MHTRSLDARPFFIERGSTVRVRQRTYGYLLLVGGFLLSVRARNCCFSVHGASTNVHRVSAAAVEQAHRVFAAVAGEVAIVAVDHFRLAPM
jgi:hypothetical protein